MPGRAPAARPFFGARLLHLVSGQYKEATVWNRDEVRGKVDQVKGRVKESVGKMSDDEELRNEGEEDQIAGNVQEGFGKGRRKVGEAIKDLGDKIGK
jgi:uncharacterized protein YjbJ (UPF0337 family)